MSRKIKNTIMIILLVGLLIASYFTISYANENTNNNVNTPEISNDMNTPPDMGNGGPPDMKNNNGDTTSSDSTENNEMTSPPEKPSGDSNESSERPTPPDMQNETENIDNNESDRKMGTPPERPSTETTENGDRQAPPDMNSTNNMDNGPIDMGDTINETSTNNILYYALFGIEGLVISLLIVYLLMSNFNKKNFKETMSSKDKLVIYILSTIVLTGCITAIDIYLKDHINSSKNIISENNKSSSASGAKEVTIEETIDGTFTSNSSDESAILVKDGGNLTLSDATITKTGDSSNTEDSEFYGINAGILVTENSTSTIKNTTISTDAVGANAVFATGDNSKIYISDSTITTTGESSSRGLDATYGGYIEADNVNITTQGGSSATLATDRGEGTVIAKNSNLETNGTGSPIIYSTGDISIEDTKGTANSSQMVVIEGKNSAIVKNSTLIASGKGNRGDTDQTGIMIYQSMSGDASEGTGTFTSKDSTLTIDSKSEYYKSAPMFFITNTDAVINLENTTLEYGSNVLISAKGTSEWGKSGSNGGNVTLNATKQTLKGNIEIDNISSLVMNLSNSKYTGTINGDNSAKSITLKLDKDSSITLTGDSYVTSLDDADLTMSNINFNGYKLYVNGKAIN